MYVYIYIYINILEYPGNKRKPRSTNRAMEHLI